MEAKIAIEVSVIQQEANTHCAQYVLAYLQASTITDIIPDEPQLIADNGSSHT